MPRPKKNESRKKFLERCIPIVMREGEVEDTKEAAGRCGGMYDHYKKGK